MLLDEHRLRLALQGDGVEQHLLLLGHHRQQLPVGKCVDVDGTSDCIVDDVVGADCAGCGLHESALHGQLQGEGQPIEGVINTLHYGFREALVGPFEVADGEVGINLTVDGIQLHDVGSHIEGPIAVAEHLPQHAPLATSEDKAVILCLRDKRPQQRLGVLLGIVDYLLKLIDSHQARLVSNLKEVKYLLQRISRIVDTAYVDIEHHSPVGKIATTPCRGRVYQTCSPWVPAY